MLGQLLFGFLPGLVVDEAGDLLEEPAQMDQVVGADQALGLPAGHSGQFGRQGLPGQCQTRAEAGRIIQPPGRLAFADPQPVHQRLLEARRAQCRRRGLGGRFPVDAVIQHRLGSSDGFAALLDVEQLQGGECVDGVPVHPCCQRLELGQVSQHRLTIGDG
jgi:hypothetical protein